MPMGNFTQYTVFENHSKCLIWILAFFASFCPIKIDLSGNTFWVRWVPRNPRFPYVQFKIFEARFARSFSTYCALQIFKYFKIILCSLENCFCLEVENVTNQTFVRRGDKTMKNRQQSKNSKNNICCTSKNAQHTAAKFLFCPKLKFANLNFNAKIATFKFAKYFNFHIKN